MELKTVRLEIPEDCNIILGQTHFIKTVEDLYEIMASTVPTAKFGIAFCEASGACLLRLEGNDEDVKKTNHGFGDQRRPHLCGGDERCISHQRAQRY
jgi:adenosine/AMP kinase